MSAFQLPRAVWALGALGLALLTPPARGDIIFQSALPGPTGVTVGFGVAGDQFLAARFHLDQAVQVDAVGGHLALQGPPGTLFAAVVALSGPAALPSGGPFDATLLAATTFTPPFPSNDILVPLSVLLGPGDYALVFGSGQFGATGRGVMPSDNVDIPGQGSRFFWDGSSWQDAALTNTRFVVSGVAVPEPGGFALLAVGAAGVVGCARRRRGRAA